MDEKEIVIMATIIQKLSLIINGILGEEMALSPETLLREVESNQIGESLGLSSIDMIDLISQAEIEFDIEISEHELVNFRSVGDLIKFIEDNQ